MNDRISDLLDHAADDGGAPLGFRGAEIARRARARQRRRYGAVATGLAAAGVAGVVMAGQLLAAPGAVGPGPATGPTGLTAVPSASQSPSLTPAEQSIVDRCAQVRIDAGTGRRGTEFSYVGRVAHSGTVPRAPHGSHGSHAGFLRDWTLDAHVQDAQGTTATFVNPARTRWASCELVAGGTDTNDEVTDRGPVPRGPVPQSWYGPGGFRHQATGPDWAQVCAPGAGKVCPRELYAGSFALYDGVKAVRVDAPDGTVLHPVLGTYTYVFRHTEVRVAAHRAANDSQPFPSMPVTLLDGQGRTIIHYDYHPSYIIPSSCPSTGGC